ncbi:NucA/NucB deoxyribonuclease domain-containing protein [Streptomyces yaizuensis]|uniref:NucA/NucB deoxyribonuclease domain-containing protein n=1 Tax=Streptomyces yaizuensis TaxID=2989713 RepID=A0ABQ5NWJ6_9ACTN|nr:NucA/NucB deoxyribonuclease domain-containing protein [Streptomyces sp. YSPA8]GLF94740.1 NucA/NucB deoxyribonuclease domain-containing protein [Streptomyces sp. YSPA8]
MNVTYHFTSMDKTGAARTSALMINPTAKVPLIVPKKAKHKFGGSLPGRKSWDHFKAHPSFTHTMNVAPGQGNEGKKTDVVHAVYEPHIGITFPTGVQGDPGGKLFFLPPRWDSASYLRNSTGGGKPGKRGAATFAIVGKLNYSAKDRAPEAGVALHIRQAFKNPEKTKPYMAAKKVPGQEPGNGLRRLYWDKKRHDENWRRAVAQCRRHYGPDYTEGGRECDEYPFASTHQGAAHSEYDPDVKKFNFSIRPVWKDDNKAAGDLLKSFYAKNRILDSGNDSFIVQITG